MILQFILQSINLGLSVITFSFLFFGGKDWAQDLGPDRKMNPNSSVIYV